ncbi:Glycerophosphodiester phosphodiesterase GDPD3 [Euphorbia peplus]|nr:Glycerophosphodiester phosphodiesterase GDPD3 [Euphorbia peplus]
MAVHVSEVPILDQVHENAALSILSGEDDNGELKLRKFVVIGHRGSGMNMLQSSDQRMKSIKENSILSFNSAAKFPLDFIEFDVQVTKDDCPIIYHDNFILTQQQGIIIEKRVTELTLAEFLSYGSQKETENMAKPLFRRMKDGRIFEWKVEEDAPLCTLQEAFEKVDESIGFNIELKFDDHIIYTLQNFQYVVQAILKVVNKHAKNRPVIFSSFQPDAALIMRKLQKTYPVFFLTNGGSEIYRDIRRNSIDEAIKVCLEGCLQGIVSEVKAILRNPQAVSKVKQSNLSLITYGISNNSPEVVFVQRLMGIEGVIVDLVQEITTAISSSDGPKNIGELLKTLCEEQQFETLIPLEISPESHICSVVTQ